MEDPVVFRLFGQSVAGRPEVVDSVLMKDFDIWISCDRIECSISRSRIQDDDFLESRQAIKASGDFVFTVLRQDANRDRNGVSFLI